VREHFYEKRLVISVGYDAAGKFDAENSTVKGNAEGLNLLGLDEVAMVKWSAVRRSLGMTTDWPAELERAMKSITTGSLPPALPPFRTSKGIYIPVISKAESVDGIVRQLAVIFVAANVERLRQLFDWIFPANMPAQLNILLQVVRMIFRARWEILEPRFKEAKFRAPATERCFEIARSVIADYDKMQQHAEREGMGGLERFYATFHRELRAEVDACGDEWAQLTKLMRATPPDSPEELGRQLKELLGNNARWLSVVGKQFVLTVAELG
jgi:hypothetical protein